MPKQEKQKVLAPHLRDMLSILPTFFYFFKGNTLQDTENNNI